MLDNYRDLIDELSEVPTTVRSIVADHTPVNSSAMAADIEELRLRDEWMMARLQTMLKQTNAYFRNSAPPTVSDVLPPLPEILDAFDHGRGELLSLLMNLTLRDWEKSAIDESEGQITVADEVERHVDFNEEQVAKITAAA